MRIGGGALRSPVVGYGWVRLLPIIGTAGTVGLLHIPEVEPSAWDWTMAMLSAGIVTAGGRWPLTVCLAQAVLLATASATAPVGATVIQIMACIGLGELALRRPGPPMYGGALAVAVSSGCNHFTGYSLAANALILSLQVGLPVLLGAYLRAQRELARQAEQRAIASERSRRWEATAARAAERNSVAHELHDVVAHHVAAIVLRVGVARHVVPSMDPRLDEALDDVHTIGGQALADLRRLVSVLRDPESVDQLSLLAPADLSTALDIVLERTRQAGVPVTADVDTNAIERLRVEHRHAVIRVVQEALTNILKHAGEGARTQLSVREHPPQGISVYVVDSGGKRSATTQKSSGGHGLVVMRERVELLRGTLSAGPGASGWALHATFPDAIGGTT